MDEHTACATISIHAPAKGATVFPVSCKCCSGISIHAPAKGATELHWVPMQWLLYFNPRSREGSDEMVHGVISLTDVISIHAPAKGATDNLAGSDISILDFNPRSREGSDPKATQNVIGYVQFQSTLPRRERLYDLMEKAEGLGFQSTLPRRERLSALDNLRTLYDFNPRSREGSDHNSVVTANLIQIFQSTLPRRERLRYIIHAFKLWIFQSTLPRRERRTTSGSQCRPLLISIHAPAKGATILIVGIVLIHTEFQSTLPRRERRTGKHQSNTVYDISIHAPAKGATETGKPLCKATIISIHAPAKGATITL